MDQNVIDKLKKISIFEYLASDSDALRSLSEIVKHKKFSRGSTIIREGEDGDELYILYAGTVEITKNTLAKDRYTVVKLSAENHAFFGELALIDNDRRSATVVASSDCDLLYIKKDQFLAIGEKNNHLGLMVTRKIAHLLAQRLRRANQDIVTLYEALVGEIEENT